MLLDFPSQIVKSPQVLLSHLLLVVAIFPLPHVPLDFPGQIVKSPQVLSHLLLVVAIFPLPRPCTSKFPRSNRQISTSPPISSAFSGRYLSLAAPMCIRFPKSNRQSPQVPSHLLLVVAIFPLPHPCAIRFPKSNRQISTSPISSALSGRYFSLAASMCHEISQFKSSNPLKSYLICFYFSGRYFSLAAPMCIHVALDFPSQIVKFPKVLSHLLLVVDIFPLPHPCAIRFPKSYRQISTSPISSAFSGRYFSLAAPMCH